MRDAYGFHQFHVVTGIVNDNTIWTFQQMQFIYGPLEMNLRPRKRKTLHDDQKFISKS